MARSFFQYPVLLVLPLFAAADAASQAPVELELVPWAQNLAAAVDITHCGDERLFVLRQWGAISVVLDSMQNQSQLFLDITAQTLYSGERGLLGLAFDPDYANNGYFYLNYVTGTGNGVSRLSRFSVSAVNPNVADPASEVVLLSIPQPDPIHKAGGLVFGPDGYLYCAFGDGGGSSDPNNYGQDPTNLFGTILRIKPELDGTYSIPPDNPFVGSPNGERPEIWAYGFRNPFRIGIDPVNGDLWVGDVGQQLWEEIDRWPGGDNSGPNFGWSCYEGNAPFEPAHCVSGAVLEPPVAVQAHSVNGGSFCAIIAGEVYRGQEYPRLEGRLLYTDYCTGGLRTLTPDGEGGYVDQLSALIPFPGMSSIGADVHGELYMTNVSQGKVYKIKDKCPMDAPSIIPDGNDLSTAEAATYEWFIDGEPVAGGDTQTISATVTGNYTVRVSFANGCVKMSSPYFHLTTLVSGSEPTQWRIFPQPAADVLNVVDLNGSPIMSIAFFDAAGRAVLSEGGAVALGVVDVSTLPSGAYLVEVRTADGRLMRAPVTVVH